MSTTGCEEDEASTIFDVPNWYEPHTDNFHGSLEAK